MRVGGARAQPSLFLSLYFKGRGPGSSSDGVGFLLGEAPGICGPVEGSRVRWSPPQPLSSDLCRCPPGGGGVLGQRTRAFKC